MTYTISELEKGKRVQMLKDGKPQGEGTIAAIYDDDSFEEMYVEHVMPGAVPTIENFEYHAGHWRLIRKDRFGNRYCDGPPWTFRPP